MMISYFKGRRWFKIGNQIVLIKSLIKQCFYNDLINGLGIVTKFHL